MGLYDKMIMPTKQPMPKHLFERRFMAHPPGGKVRYIEMDLSCATTGTEQALISNIHYLKSCLDFMEETIVSILEGIEPRTPQAYKLENETAVEQRKYDELLKLIQEIAYILKNPGVSPEKA